MKAILGFRLLFTMLFVLLFSFLSAQNIPPLKLLNSIGLDKRQTLGLFKLSYRTEDTIAINYKQNNCKLYFSEYKFKGFIYTEEFDSVNIKMAKKYFGEIISKLQTNYDVGNSSYHNNYSDTSRLAQGKYGIIKKNIVASAKGFDLNLWYNTITKKYTLQFFAYQNFN